MRGLKHILAAAGMVGLLLVTSTANAQPQGCNIGPPPQVRASAINNLAIPAQTDVAVAAPSLNLNQIALSAPAAAPSRLSQVAARPVNTAAVEDQAGIFRRRCRGGSCGRLELDRNASLAFAGAVDRPPALGSPGSKLASR